MSITFSPRTDVLILENGTLTVEVHYMARTGFALAHNSIPVVEAVWVHNSSEDASTPAGELTLRGIVNGETLFDIGDLQIPILAPRGRELFTQQVMRESRIDPSHHLLQRSESLPGRLELNLSLFPDEAPAPALASVQGDLRVLAPNEWFNSPPYFESLVAFVQPNIPAVTDVVRMASDILLRTTGSGSINGYQAGPQRALEIAAAVYAAMQQLDIRYISPPASFEDTGQRVRTTEEVFNTKFGTCIDLSVAYAAVAQQCGLKPVILLVPGHALLGISTRETGLKEPVLTDSATIHNHLRSGHIIPFDAAFYDREISFAQNVKRWQQRFADQDTLAMIGVQESHEDGIRPLPSERSWSASDALDEPVPDSTEASSLEAVRGIGSLMEALAPSTSEGDEYLDPQDQSPARVQRWKRELLDLSLNNRLLNLKPGPEVLEFELRKDTLAELDDRIHRGDRISVHPHDDLSANRMLQGYESVAELPDEIIADALADRSQLFAHVTDYSYPNYFKRLARLTKTLLEETGSANLYLTLGAMEYTSKNGRNATAPLFLIPVKIVGGKGRTRFAIQADATQPASPNHSLVEWLRQEHFITIEALSNPKLDHSGLDVDFALREISAALIEANLPFAINHRAHLVIAKFSTYGMWKDLRDNWQRFMKAPVFEHLTLRPGESFVEPGLDARIQDVPVDESALALPIPADGAQMQVVAAAGHGYSFVVEGPPGTGKSQTITNTLAHLMAQGKKVLFVAEKQAALDVVKGRMTKIGLAPFILDLHGAEQRPAAIREQLRNAMDASVHYDMHRWDNAQAQLRARIEPLASYPQVVHDENRLGHSLWTAMIARQDLGDGPVAPIPESFVQARSSAQWRMEIEQALPDIGVAARTTDLSHTNDWAIVGDNPTSEHEWDDALEALQLAHSYLSAFPTLEKLLLAPNPQAIREALGGSTILITPQVAQQLQGSPQRLANLAGQLRRITSDVRHLNQVFSPTFLLYGDVAPIHQAITDVNTSGFFGKKKRLAAYEVALGSCLSEGQTPLIDADHSPSNIASALGRLEYVRQALREFDRERHSIPGVGDLGSISIADPALPDHLEERANAIHASVELASQYPDLANYHATSPLPVSLPQAMETVESAWRDWLRVLDVDEAHLAAWLDGRTWPAALLEEYPRWRDAGLKHLSSTVQWRKVTTPLRDAGLHDFVQSIADGRIPNRDITLAFKRGLAQASIDERVRTFNITHFRPEQSESDVAELQKAMTRVREEATQALPAIVMGHRSFQTGRLTGSVASLRRSLDAKRQAASFRSLMETYAQEILEATPCVFASPASLATFVDPKATTFDVIIFDEASQITVDQAMGAIGRAKSVIIAGDSRQMPPTRIGKVSLNDAADDDDPDNPNAVPVVEDLESILSEAVESGLPQLWLSWHYRSRDESLIAFSNQTYYEGLLSSLPSPGQHPQHKQGMGVRLVRVDGHFDRSKGKSFRTNRAEAEAIVENIEQRLNDPLTSSSSIGVVTFNIQQRNLILDLLEESADPLVRACLETADEPIFVKNLENVQGDERDVILFSTAFSPKEPGGPLPMNFGPLSRQGGERRLNVAVTRARSEVIVFSSFDPEAIDLNRTKSAGLRDLREYMIRARDGQLAMAGDGAGPSINDNPLRDALATALEAQGWIVEKDFGLSNYTLDLVVRSSDDPRWLVAVVGDGAKWRAMPTVADRDLTPPLLRDLMGWLEIVRVWTPEWNQSPESVINRVEEAAASARKTLAEVDQEREDHLRRQAELLASRKAELQRTEELESAAAAEARAENVDEAEIDAFVADALASPPTEPAEAVEWHHDDAALPPESLDRRHDVQPTRSTPTRLADDSPGAHHPATNGTDLPTPVEYIELAVDAIGIREELEAPIHPQRLAEVQELVRQMAADSGPVTKQNMRIAIAKRFGRARTSARILGRLDQFIPRELVKAEGRDKTEFVWPSADAIEAWNHYRPKGGRAVADISLRELGNVARVVLTNRPWLKVRQGDEASEELVRAVLAYFEVGRVTPKAIDRTREAIALMAQEHSGMTRTEQ